VEYPGKFIHIFMKNRDPGAWNLARWLA
jgi:hypothetical protein